MNQLLHLRYSEYNLIDNNKSCRSKGKLQLTPPDCSDLQYIAAGIIHYYENRDSMRKTVILQTAAQAYSSLLLTCLAFRSKFIKIAKRKLSTPASQTETIFNCRFAASTEVYMSK